MTPQIDYRGLFAATPSPYLVLDPDSVIVDVNEAYLRAAARSRQDLIGQHLFEAFPDNPADPDADGVRNLDASLRRALDSKERDTMAATGDWARNASPMPCRPTSASAAAPVTTSPSSSSAYEPAPAIVTTPRAPACSPTP